MICDRLKPHKEIIYKSNVSLISFFGKHSLYTSDFILSKLDISGYSKIWQKRNIDKLLYIISCIYLVPKMDFSYRNQKNPFVRLKSIYFKRILGDRYRKLVDILIDQKIIECNEKYWYVVDNKGNIIDGESKKFRFHPDIYNQHIENNIKFRQIKTRLKLDFKKISRPKTESEKYLNSILLRTTIDLPEAKRYIDSLVNINEIEQSTVLVNRIYNKNYNTVRSLKVGRIYNEITNLPRELRPFLRIDGEKLIEVDVKCCQPLLFQYFYDKKRHKEEYLRFKKLVEKDDFYDFMAKEIYGKRKITRWKFKISFYKYIFGPEYNTKKNASFYWFMNKHFPILSTLIDKEKRYDYADFVRKLQNMEAKVFIDDVVIRCKKLNIPLLTVHDSVLIKEKDKQKLEEMIVDSFQKHYDITPQFKP